jgi:uncharacterized membrane protein YoaK (UPF0700 family)
MLTAAAASADALTYLGLGKVFPANMTGNTVLLAIAVSSAEAGAAARSGVALGAFIGGAFTAGLISRANLRGLVGESAALAAAAAWWCVIGADPLGAQRYGLIALVSFAMGLQSGQIARLGVPVSTTYITGTWTAVSAAAARWAHHRRTGDAHQIGLQVTVLATYFGAALASVYIERTVGVAAAIVPAALVAAVTGAAAICRLTPPPPSRGRRPTGSSEWPPRG